MSGMNALSGITLLGAVAAVGLSLIAVDSGGRLLGQLLGGIAIIAATVNVVGGFGVTHRMLKMFDKKKKKNYEQYCLYHHLCTVVCCRFVRYFADEQS